MRKRGWLPFWRRDFTPCAGHNIRNSARLWLETDYF